MNIKDNSAIEQEWGPLLALKREEQDYGGDLGWVGLLLDSRESLGYCGV